MPIEFAYLNSAEYGVEGKSANEWKLLANTTQTSDENYATYNTNYNNAMEKAQRAYQRDMAAWNAAQNTAEYDALKRQAEMDHEVVLQDIKNKEAAIDMKINPLQAEHEALKTESESLKSLPSNSISSEIDSSNNFNLANQKNITSFNNKANKNLSKNYQRLIFLPSVSLLITISYFIYTNYVRYIFQKDSKEFSNSFYFITFLYIMIMLTYFLAAFTNPYQTNVDKYFDA